ncbi:DUF2809 domain-containing protein [Oryzifoliimicrobium ureilyticus]|uniref:ribosomal maturation YjgA family protein n=1 Tax=Oryzifoliimicrobium ureilyticus TaxID=3113724 RepID=UPI0030760D6F
MALVIIAITVIFLGLGLRAVGYRLGLTFPVVKYGGSVLWGSMVYFLLASIVLGWRRSHVVLMAIALACLVEFSRLYHTPGLDSFRLTTTGALLLGRVFSPWNLLAYTAGIVVAAGFDRLVFPSSSSTGYNSNQSSAEVEVRASNTPQ